MLVHRIAYMSFPGHAGSVDTVDSKKMNTDYLLSKALELLTSVLDDAHPDEAVPPELAADGQFSQLYRKLFVIRSFFFDISNGKLDTQLKEKGFCAGSLKNFQADLRHLIWQTKCVASNDFTQRVHFMGEFSDAFNSMVQQLQKSTTDLSRSREEYRVLSETDQLTGLLNRRAFFEMGRLVMERASVRNNPVSLIMIDIDFFK